MERRIKMTDRQLKLLLSCIRDGQMRTFIYDDLDDVAFQLENLLGEIDPKGKKR